MEIDYYELENILKIDKNGFCIMDSSIIKYINNSEKYFLSEIINSLGNSSNIERHLYKPITNSDSFFNSENKKTIIIKIEKNIIIGFISYEYRPINLRNEYNFNNYFTKTLLTINDFYVFRPYQRMNYGKELFDKLIQLENIKPVSMAFELPNRALINFLYKNYGISNPISQINDIITYYNFNDKSFNKYLDDYHRKIDVNKMENDIESYRKWSPLNNDYYKRYNSNYSYKNIFPLNFKSNKININNNNRYKNININNDIIENNIFPRKSYNKNIDINNNLTKDNKYKMKYNYDLKNNTNSNLNQNNLLKLNQYDIDQEKKENYKAKNNSFNGVGGGKYNNNGKNELVNFKKYHLLDKKNIYGKQNYNENNNLNSVNNIKTYNIKKNDYYFKFNDYYLNENFNSLSSRDLNFNTDNKNSIKDNYYNHLNDENRYLNNIIIKQKEKNDKLARNINNLNEKITELKYKTPQKNNYNKEFYYHKNRSFATLFDSIQNKLQEEKDFNEYKKYKMSQEYSNYY